MKANAILRPFLTFSKADFSFWNPFFGQKSGRILKKNAKYFANFCSASQIFYFLTTINNLFLNKKKTLNFVDIYGWNFSDDFLQGMEFCLHFYFCQIARIFGQVWHFIAPFVVASIFESLYPSKAWGTYQIRLPNKCRQDSNPLNLSVGQFPPLQNQISRLSVANITTVNVSQMERPQKIPRSDRPVSLPSFHSRLFSVYLWI